MRLKALSATLILILIHQSASDLVCNANIDCPPGYKQQKRVCVDVDECADGLCAEEVNTDCFNYPGGYDCNCTEGYEFVEEVGMCKRKSCDEGWERFGKFCYKYDKNKYNFFYDAEADCVAQGAHLISIHSEEELDWFEKRSKDDIAADPVPTKSWWIGFYRDPAIWTQDQFGLWMSEQLGLFLVWMDGEPFTGLPGRLEPLYRVDPGPQEENYACVYFWEGEFWPEKCTTDRPYPFICQKAKEGASCETDWIEVENECFYQETGLDLPFNNASLNCQQKGAYLAKIKTQAQSDALKANGKEGIIGLTSTLKSYDLIIARVGEVYSWTDGTSYKPDIIPWTLLLATDNEMKVFRTRTVDGERVYEYTNGVSIGQNTYYCKKQL